MYQKFQQYRLSLIFSTKLLLWVRMSYYVCTHSSSSTNSLQITTYVKKDSQRDELLHSGSFMSNYDLNEASIEHKNKLMINTF